MANQNGVLKKKPLCHSERVQMDDRRISLCDMEILPPPKGGVRMTLY